MSETPVSSVFIARSQPGTHTHADADFADYQPGILLYVVFRGAEVEGQQSIL